MAQPPIVGDRAERNLNTCVLSILSFVHPSVLPRTSPHSSTSAFPFLSPLPGVPMALLMYRHIGTEIVVDRYGNAIVAPTFVEQVFRARRHVCMCVRAPA